MTGQKDKLVQARFRVCKGDKANETQALRIAVVVPLADGQLCKLEGEDLSLESARVRRPCEIPASSRTLTLLEVTQQGRKVVQTKDQSGSCDDPAGSASAVKPRSSRRRVRSQEDLRDADLRLTTRPQGRS